MIIWTRFFKKLKKRKNYEDRQLSIWWLAPWMGYHIIFSPEIVKSLVRKQQHHKPFLYKILGDTFLQDGILVSDVEKWKKRRKLITPAFHTEVLESCYSTIQEKANSLCRKILETNSKPVDMKKLFRLFTTDVIMAVAMGIEIDALYLSKTVLYSV